MAHLSELISIAEEYSKGDISVNEQTTFEEMNLDEYEIVDFVLRVEEMFTVVIDDSKIFQFRSLKDVADALCQVL